MVEDISFQNSTPVATVPIAECAEPVSFFRGRRLVIMYNLRKRDGSVNGKFCTLLGVEGSAMYVVLRPGGLTVLPLWTFDDGGVFSCVACARNDHRKIDGYKRAAYNLISGKLGHA